MRQLQQRGNILITALFMAVFLFFLSVAMISQNRMDLSLALSVDHRVKSDAAARAGLNWALHTMRTQPNWVKLLQEEKPTLESGATFAVEVRGRRTNDGDPHLLVVTSTGTSSLVSSVHWAVVEEVQKTPREVQDVNAQLFTRAWNKDRPPKPDNLAMLGSDFQWYDLGPLPSGETTLEASGGPLFVFAPAGSAQEPPSLIDNLPMFVQNEEGVVEPTVGPRVRLELVPPGRHLLHLAIKDGQGEWVDIPDPGPALGSWAGLTEVTSEQDKALPVIRMWEDPNESPVVDEEPPWDRRSIHLTGRGDRDSGFDIFTIDTEQGVWNEQTQQYESLMKSKPWTDVYVYSLEELTLDWEVISDTPLVYLEWYSLTGEALAARGNKIACQAEHYFYGHIPEVGQTFPDLGTPVYESIVYRRPCVLEYDLEEKTWTRLVDLMNVPKKNATPELIRSPQWNDNFLKVDSQSRPVIASKHRSETALLHFTSQTNYHNLGQVPGTDPRITMYDDQLYYTVDDGSWAHFSKPRLALRSLKGKTLDPQSQLGGTVPPVTAKMLEAGEEKEIQLKPREQISVGLVGKRFDTTSWGSSLFAVGYVHREVEDLEFPQQGDYNAYNEGALTKPKTLATFFHYNGLSWQAWPGGIDNLLKSHDDLFDVDKLPVPSLTEHPIELFPSNIAVGSYVDGYPDLRRYTVIASGKDKPPLLRGFESPK